MRVRDRLDVDTDMDRARQGLSNETLFVLIG
jgi:hypothetical protein